MWLHWLSAIFLASCCMVALGGKTVMVTNSSCRGAAHNVDNDVNLKYTGGHLYNYSCVFEFKVKIDDDDDLELRLCVEPVIFELPCGIKVKYSEAVYSSSHPNKEYDCYNSQYTKWCPMADRVYIGFERDSSSYIGDANFEVKITTWNPFGSEVFTDDVMRIVYIVITVVGVVIVVALIGVCCHCLCRIRSKPADAGDQTPEEDADTTALPLVANPPQQQAASQPPQTGYQATPLQAGYPPQQQSKPPQAGYQPPAQSGYPPQQQSKPPQAGYQPPPQAGYQPPPQPSYQPPPQAGYQPPPQAGYQAPPQAGYQAPQQGYQPPPQVGYQPQQQGYQAGYQPPAQGYPTGVQPPPAGYQQQAPPMP